MTSCRSVKDYVAEEKRSINMKSLVIFSFLLLGFISQSSSQDYSFEIAFDEQDQECLHKFGMDEDVIKDEFGENFKVVEGNPQINKFLACAWDKKGILTKYGDVNKHKLREFLKNWDFTELYTAFHVRNTKNVDKMQDEAVEACSSMRGRDNGDTAAKIYNCLVDHTLLKRLF